MTTEDFYDQIASFYDLIYPDWDASIERQAAQLAALIRRYERASSETLLDVSCGIGTQALGLASAGFKVTASDLSSKEVQRAKSEATKRNLNIDFSVCDMRDAYSHHQTQYDVVLSADNSVPHLLADEDIYRAFEQFYKCTKPGGLCILSLRDYENEKLESGTIRPYAVKEREDGRYLIFQVWDVSGDTYETSMYMVKDLKNGRCESVVSRATYSIVLISKIIELLERSGFTDVSRVDGAFFQPVVVGRRGE